MKLVSIHPDWMKYFNQYEKMLQEHWEKYYVPQRPDGSYSKYSKSFDYRIRVEVGHQEMFSVNVEYNGTRPSNKDWKGETKLYTLPKPLLALQTSEQWEEFLEKVKMLFEKEKENEIPF